MIKVRKVCYDTSKVSGKHKEVVCNRPTWDSSLLETFKFIKKDTCKAQKFLPIPPNIPMTPTITKINEIKKSH